jgi:thermitase
MTWDRRDAAFALAGIAAYSSAMRSILAAVLLMPCAAHAAASPSFRMEGDRLTLSAHQTPLVVLLRSFSHAGVRVNVDPGIDLRVTGSCEDEPMEDALDDLLGELSYVLVWEVVKGPLGDLPRLAEMNVFLPGQRQAARPLEPAQRNLRIARGPTGQGPEFVADEILIGMKPGTSVEAFRALLAQIGGTVIGSIPGLGIYQVRLLPGTNIPALVDQLKNNPAVNAVEPNYAARVPAPDAADKAEPGTLADVTYAPGAARIAVIDSGLLPQSGIGQNVVASFDALLPGQALGDPVGHGTQMAMIATGAVQPSGAATDNPQGVPVVAIRAFDDNGYTSNYALMRSIDFAIEQGARVINLSWGSETPSEFVETSVAYAQSKGLVVVASAGNTPTGQPVYPAAYPGVVSVAALDTSGEAWEKSNYGSSVSIAAPGVASFPVGHQGPPGAYVGTSISSAYVSRELALYFTANPKATPQDAVRALQASATDAGTPGKDPYYGYGTLDAQAATKLRGP